MPIINKLPFHTIPFMPESEDRMEVMWKSQYRFI